VIGYILALFAATVGVAAFPFSLITLGLVFVVVGAFFVLAVSVIVMAYVLMAITVARAIMGLGRRLLFGTDRDSRAGKNSELHGPNNDLWDQWIDGAIRS
jgi:uncharacterized membrane protein YdfJ with MMPL/SSD domain